MKIDKKIPTYLQRANKGGLFIGFIYVLVFMSILFLWIWQTFESEDNKSSMNLMDERLAIIEEQINIVDETNNDTITDISSSIQFLDKEIRKLWDLSNKRNKVNIQKLSEQTIKIEQLLKQNRVLERELAATKQQILGGDSSDLTERVIQIGKINILIHRLDGLDAKSLRTAIDKFKSKLGSAIVILGSIHEDKVKLAVGVTKDLNNQISAGNLIKSIAEIVGCLLYTSPSPRDRG